MPARMSQGCWWNGGLTRVEYWDLGMEKLDKEGRPDDGARKKHMEEHEVF